MESMLRDDLDEEDKLWHTSLPLRWNNLTVEGVGTGEELSSDLAVSLGVGLVEKANALVDRLVNSHSKPHNKVLLKDLNGVVQRGEMLLVLGRPQSGVTTLLRTLATDWEGFASVHGDIDYGKIDAKHMHKLFQSQVCYLPPEDSHFPSISTAETLSLALSASTPSKLRRHGETRSQWKRRRLDKLLSDLGLQHARDTPVGSELIKGLSGGERKRVSVAEVLAARPSVMCLDGITDGLDSSTALQLITTLQDLARTRRRTVLVGLNQVGDLVYNKFDKVLLLNQGRQVYFGPASQARAYLESKGFEFTPGQTIAEFLCACTDPTNRRINPEFRGRVPNTPLKLAHSFEQSSFHNDLQQSSSEYEQEENLEASLRMLQWGADLECSSIYLNFFRQIDFLTRRQYAFIRADIIPYITKTFVNICMSILVGTVFLHLPKSSDGAFTRGSILLLAILFNGYLQLAELGNVLIGRPIVKRQCQFGFYNPGTMAIARVLGDLPLIALQVILFAGITYFLAGLQFSLQKFAIYVLFVYATAFNLTTLFRMFAAFSPSFDEAMRYCGITLNILVVYAGYFIPTPSIHFYLRWIHTLVDPISYAYEAVLVNEFQDLDLACSPSHIVPHGPGYNDSRYQTCTLKGSKPGSLLVKGEDYLDVSFGFSYDNMWNDLGVIMLLATIFFAIAIFATEALHFAPSGRVRVYARKREVVSKFKKLKKYGPSEEDSSYTLDGDAHLSLLSDSTALDTPVSQGAATLTWQKLSYSLPPSAGSEGGKLLEDINGYIMPGKITALMGVSGAGKTTLLNTLAGRHSVGVVSGDIIFNGTTSGPDITKLTGYVEQFGLHDTQCTVREALEFSAFLRQDQCMTKRERLETVDFVLDVLELYDIQHALVGNTMKGISLEQRKRLTIAVELVSRPSLLFLDEPTSGLDCQSAYHIVLFMKKLSKKGITILATIHQPSPEIFFAFDDLLLLQKGGQQIYFGPTSSAVSYFESKSGISAEGQNPAEYVLTFSDLAVKNNLSKNNCAEINWSKKWKNSSEAKVAGNLSHILNEQTSIRRQNVRRGRINNASVSTQCYELTKRVYRHFWRDVSFSYTKIFTSLVVGLIVGISFAAQGYTIVSMQNRMFSIFLVLFIPPVLMNQNIMKTFTMRSIWESREKPAQIYGPMAFCTSLVLGDAPYMVVCATIYFVVWYFFVGFPLKAFTILYCYAMVLVFFFFQSFFALWITALAPTAGTVFNLLPFFLVSMEVFNGSLISYSQMNPAWHWLYWVSPFQWYVKGIMGVSLHEIGITCSESELVNFESPPGMRCSEYTESYLLENPGYLTNDTMDSSSCKFCPFANGDEFMSTLNISWNDRWLSLGILTLYTCINLGLFFLLTHYPPRIPQMFRRVFEKHQTAAIVVKSSTSVPAVIEGEDSPNFIKAVSQTGDRSSQGN